MRDKRISLPSVVAVLILFTGSSRAAPTGGDDAAMWDLSDIYATTQDWSRAHDKAVEQTKALNSYAGTLGQSPEQLLKALGAISVVRKESSRLVAYAALKSDENVKIGENHERLLAAQTLYNMVGENTAWVAPEILKLGAPTILGYENRLPELKTRFGFFLDNTLRYAPHTLGVEAEGVMASAANVLSQPDNIYSQLANGELPYPTVTLANGESIKLDQAAYENNRQSSNRTDRKLVFDAYWPAFSAFQGTFGAMLTTSVLADEFDAQARHFPDALDDAIFSDNMPESVYRMLVAEANKNLPVLHRYLKLRERALNIDKLAYYDLYAPIFELQAPPHFTLDESKRIALDVTRIYGPEYGRMLQKGLSSRWMNVYPAEGKANGAYMNNAAYDVHPYLLFNNHDDYESLSTFLHEWGHAVHTLLADAAQPYETANYSTFIAETASITNEILLVDYMTAHAKSDMEKLHYLGRGLDQIRSTFFRQTMFAEFQLAIHAEVEKGGTLSGERMTNMYCSLVKHYYGEEQGVTVIDPKYCSEWAFIPHFYYGFYVWQYATSMAGAAQFAEALETQGATAQARYLKMLRAGGSDYPYLLYKAAGLDMASATPYEALAKRMTRLMDQIEAIQKKRR